MTAGTVTVPVVPVIPKGAGKEIQEELAKGAGGNEAGEKIGQDITESLKGTGEEAGDGWGNEFIAGLTALGVGAIFADQFNTAMNIEGGQAKLTAQLGLTAEESKKYGEIAGNLYSNAYGDSMESTNEAVYAVLGSIKGARNMAASEVEGMAADILNVSDTYGASTEEITRAAQNAINNGLAPDFESAMDLIVSGYQRTGQAGLDWADTVNEYSGDFDKLGLSGGEALSVIDTLVQNGARNTDVAADGLREFGIRAREGSDATKEALTAIGLNADEMIAAFQKGGPAAKSAFQQVTTALKESGDAAQYAAIFGTQAEDGFAAFSQTDFSGAVSSAQSFTGAAENIDAVLGDTTQSTLTSLQRTFETLFSDVLLPMLDDVAPLLQDIVGYFKENKDVVAAILGPVLALGGGFAAITAAIGAYNSISAIWKTATIVQTAAQWALNSALLANPITWIILAIAALVAALVWFFTQTELGQEIWTNVMNAIGTAFTWLWESVLQPIFGFIGAIFTWLWETIIMPVGQFIAQAFQTIGAVVVWLWENILQPIINMWITIFQVIGVIIMWLWISVVQPVFNFIGAIFTWIYQNIILPWFNNLKAGFTALGIVFQWLYNTIIKPVFDAIAGVFNWIWNSIIKPVFDWIGGALKAVGEAFGTVFGAVGNVIKGAFTGVVDFIKGVINTIIDVINGVIDGINGMAETVKNATGGAIDVNIANVPKLAQGATVMPTNGGTVVRVAEAGKPESVVDTGLLNSQMEELAKLKGSTDNSSRQTTLNITVNGRDRSDSDIAKAIGREANLALRVQQA